MKRSILLQFLLLALYNPLYSSNANTSVNVKYDIQKFNNLYLFSIDVSDYINYTTQFYDNRAAFF